MSEIVVVDIGGTHARFALAELSGRRVARLGEAVVLRTADHAGLAAAWAAFARTAGRVLPRQAALAVACPVSPGALQLTNNPWTLHTDTLAAELDVDRCILLNDFAAVGHAVAQAAPDHLTPVCGPAGPMPEDGVFTVIGPGTGLGVAMVVKRGGSARVIPTEGGHAGFVPTDAFEDRLAHRLRARFGRVSAERVVSGPGLLAIYETLLDEQGIQAAPRGDRAVWDAALAGTEPLAMAALDHFCRCFGAVAGDLALAQGANAVVLAGGISPRIDAVLPRSGFAARFAAKGRFEAMMQSIPVRLAGHHQPGLFGAAAAFAAEE